MNNDKLLIVVTILVLYLLCFRRSEGQETEGDYICKLPTNFNDTIDGRIDAKLNGLVDGTFADWVNQINNHQHYGYNGEPGSNTGDHEMTVNVDQTSGPKYFKK